MPAPIHPWSSSFFFSHTQTARTHACKFSPRLPGGRFLSRKRENVVVQKLLCRVSLAYTIYHPPTLSCPSYFFLSIFLPRSPRHTVSPNEICYMNGIRSRELNATVYFTFDGEGVGSLSLSRSSWISRLQRPTRDYFSSTRSNFRVTSIQFGCVIESVHGRRKMLHCVNGYVVHSRSRGIERAIAEWDSL